VVKNYPYRVVNSPHVELRKKGNALEPVGVKNWAESSASLRDESGKQGRVSHLDFCVNVGGSLDKKSKAFPTVL
jgi:hypothetical protein